jgi:hypothetical protein
MLRMIEAVMPSATAFPGEPGIDLTTEDVDPSATALPGVADMVTPVATATPLTFIQLTRIVDAMI